MSLVNSPVDNSLRSSICEGQEKLQGQQDSSMYRGVEDLS